MDHNAQLKLQALLDGELPEAEASEVTNRLSPGPRSRGFAGGAAQYPRGPGGV